MLASVYSPQVPERSGADRLLQGLGAKIGRSDRVRVVDDRGPPRVVASDSHCQPEGEDEGYEAEERRLEDAERLAQLDRVRR